MKTRLQKIKNKQATASDTNRFTLWPQSLIWRDCGPGIRAYSGGGYSKDEL